MGRRCWICDKELPLLHRIFASKHLCPDCIRFFGKGVDPRQVYYQCGECRGDMTVFRYQNKVANWRGKTHVEARTILRDVVEN
jgi:hypothetical protein